MALCLCDYDHRDSDKDARRKSLLKQAVAFDSFLSLSFVLYVPLLLNGKWVVTVRIN